MIDNAEFALNKIRWKMSIACSKISCPDLGHDE